VLEGIKACSRFLFGTDDMAGRSVAVQGVGSVGHNLLVLLAAEGAGPLYFTDIDPAAVERTVASGLAEHVEPDAIYACGVDVFSPCAVGAVLDAKTIPRLRCRAVAGGANNQLATPEDGGRLADRGILYAPDYVVNGGGALALPALERMGWTDDQVVEGLVGIGRTLDQLFRVAADEGIPTAEAAERMAQARLARGGT
jgi:leucine dehydrogenase